MDEMTADYYTGLLERLKTGIKSRLKVLYGSEGKKPTKNSTNPFSRLDPSSQATQKCTQFHHILSVNS